MTNDYTHFEGKSALEHLKAARQKGATATAEAHGVEIPGPISAGTDSCQETSILLAGICILLTLFQQPYILSVLILSSIGWLLWKVGRSSMLGWARLERLHRLIEQERWEIQHHRSQERDELTEMYRQKGLKGKLLEQVIDVLMADDNRLLMVMLEEELGLSIESYDHPLKQALGAGLGVFIALTAGCLSYWLGGFLALLITLACTFGIATLIRSKMEGNHMTKSLIWNIATGVLSLGTIYFLSCWMGHV